MPRVLIELLVTLCAVTSAHAADSPHHHDGPDGSPVTLANTETRELRSTSNGQLYQLKIKFPRGYETETAHYPVLYVTDAETNFGAVSYIVQRLTKDHLIPKILVVGIAYDTDYRNFYRLRSRDLTPTEDPDLRIGGRAVADPTGGANVFCDFIEDQLVPFIDRKYRTKKGDRALYGHSYGGLFGCHVLLSRPDLFQRYLLLSPSLWFDDRVMFDRIESAIRPTAPLVVYLASGELEGRIDDLQVHFVELLNNHPHPQIELTSEVLENETHRTIFGRGITNGLRRIYAEQP